MARLMDKKDQITHAVKRLEKTLKYYDKYVDDWKKERDAQIADRPIISKTSQVNSS
jgi:hypothetical protein